MSGLSSTTDAAASAAAAAAVGAPARKPLAEKDKKKWNKLLADTEKLDQLKEDSVASRFYDYSVSIAHSTPGSTTRRRN
jgi:hypothetical protein